MKLTKPSLNRERYGRRIPLDETVVSPESIFASPHLKAVLTT